MTPELGKSTRGKAIQDLRIALFCANFQGVADGASKVLNRLVAYLLGHGAAVRVYSAAVGNRPAHSAVEVVAVPSVPLPGRPEYRLSLGLTRRLRADVRQFRPNLVHISVPDLGGTQAQALAREMGVPVVGSLHTRFETYLDYYGLGFLRPLVERRLRRFYSNCDAVLVPSVAIADEIRAKGWARDVYIWSRGVDRSLFNPARRSEEWRQRHGFSCGDVVLLFFGRLVREKGLTVFAATVEELKRRGHGFQTLVVGDGPGRALLQRLVPDAVFTGHLEGEELARAVASADVFINPSTTEAFGNVNLEAMASGLAIVGANLPNARELFLEGSLALLIAPDDVAAYADAVEQLIHAPARRKNLGRAALAASSLYDWEEVLGAVLDLYLAVA